MLPWSCAASLTIASRRSRLRLAIRLIAVGYR
jgi:hypothetical protein